MAEQAIDAIRQYIAERLDYLAQLVYYHECNIPEPTMSEQAEYGEALGERQALQNISQIINEAVSSQAASQGRGE